MVKKVIDKVGTYVCSNFKVKSRSLQADPGPKDASWGQWAMNVIEKGEKTLGRAGLPISLGPSH